MIDRVPPQEGTRIPDVQMQHEILHKAACQLQDKIIALAERLNSVIIARPTQQSDKNDQPGIPAADSHCDVASRMIDTQNIVNECLLCFISRKV